MNTNNNTSTTLLANTAASANKATQKNGTSLKQSVTSTLTQTMGDRKRLEGALSANLLQNLTFKHVMAEKQVEQAPASQKESKVDRSESRRPEPKAGNIDRSEQPEAEGAPLIVPEHPIKEQVVQADQSTLPSPEGNQQISQAQSGMGLPSANGVTLPQEALPESSSEGGELTGLPFEKGRPAASPQSRSLEAALAASNSAAHEESPASEVSVHKATLLNAQLKVTGLAPNTVPEADLSAMALQAASGKAGVVGGESLLKGGLGLRASSVSPTGQLLTAGAQFKPHLAAQQARGEKAAIFQTGVQVPVNDSRWSSAIHDRVMWMASKNISEAEIHLNPEELGPLQVKVTLSQDQTQAQISFVSQQATVREALDQSAFRLRELLHEQGMGEVDVDVSGQSFAEQSDYDSEQQADHRGRSEKNHQDTVLVEQAVTTLNPASLVDYYA